MRYVAARSVAVRNKRKHDDLVQAQRQQQQQQQQQQTHPVASLAVRRLIKATMKEQKSVDGFPGSIYGPSGPPSGQPPLGRRDSRRKGFPCRRDSTHHSGGIDPQVLYDEIIQISEDEVC